MKRPANAYPDRSTAIAYAVNRTVFLQPAAPSNAEKAATLWLNPGAQMFTLHPDGNTVEHRSYIRNFRFVSRIIG